jgi:glycosyltransferase involved in cell wall biosynthesis
MRVLELVTSAQWGGAQAQVLQYAEELSRRGADVTLACGEDGPLLRRAAGMGLQVHQLRWLRTPPSPHSDLFALHELETLIGTSNPDVVHTHSSKAGVLGRVAAGRVAMSPGGRPAVVHHCHGLAWGMGRSATLASEFYRRIERATGHLCDGVISVSYAVQRQLLADKTYPKARHAMIHNGLDLGHAGRGPFTADAEHRRLLGLPTAGALIAHVGRVVQGKGHDLAIDAVQLLVDAGDDVNLLIVGDGPLVDGLRNQTERNSDLRGRIHFLGFRTDIATVLRASDLLCLPSQTEGLPLVIIEAMAAGLPTVATAVGGVPEVVVSGETGLLLDPSATPDQLAQALHEVLADPVRAREMGAAGRRRAERHFSLQNSARTVDFLYEMIQAARTAA